MLEVKPSSPMATSGSTEGKVRGAGVRAGRASLSSIVSILFTASS